MTDAATENAFDAAFAKGEQTFRRNITAAIAVAIVALLALAATSVWLYARERSYGAWVEHTYEAEAKASRLATLVEQLETARRGYLISPRAAYWATYQAVRVRLTPDIDDFARFTADNAAQRRNVAALRQQVAEKYAQLERSIDLAHAGDMATARRNFIVDQDQRTTERLRATLRSMLEQEQQLLVRRSHDERTSSFLLLAASLGVVGLLLALGIGSVVLVRRYSSELQRAQSSLRRLNLGLEAAVAERTQDLTRANEEIQRFAYIVSHDLRSPLVNIMGFTSELEAASPSLHRLIEAGDAAGPEVVPKDARAVVEEELPEAIGFIRKSTQKMDRLINAILKLSREGRRNLTIERLDMNGLVGGVAATLYQLAESKRAEIVVEPALPELMGDRVSVEQVFSNLVENAVKYLKPGEPGRVVVKGRPSGSRAIFEIVDNGRGIDPKDHQRIFDLFRRSGAQDQPGEGIGLAHVRALVYRMGGTIDCESRLGEGATFKVSLPRQPIRQEEAA